MLVSCSEEKREKVKKVQQVVRKGNDERKCKQLLLSGGVRFSSFMIIMRTIS